MGVSVERHTHGRPRTARKALAIALACLFALVFAGRASADSLYWDDIGGSTFANFGPNQSIIIGAGTIENACLTLGEFQADVYVVPSGSVSVGSTLHDVNGAPNVIQTPLTGGLFVDETIGFTAPTGSIGPGTYAVVYDDCQNGKLDPGDFVLDPAFTVTVPTNVPPLPGGLSGVKSDAQAQADKAAKAAKTLSALFAAYELWNAVSDAIDATTGTLLVNLYMNYLCNYITPSIDGSPVTPWCPTVSLEDRLRLELQTVLLQVNEGRHWAGIAADPPDPSFKDPPVLAPVIASVPASESPVDRAVAAYVAHDKVTEASSDALLHAIERYQGASAGGDGAAALMQAREIQAYAATAAAELRASNPLIDDMLADIAASGRDVLRMQDVSTSLQARLRTSGLTSAEHLALRNLGLSDADIETATNRFENGDFSIVGAGSPLTSALDELKAQNAATAGSLDSLGAAMSANVDALAAQGFDVTPHVSAGGPYTGTTGSPLALHADATDPAGGTLTLSWDLNGDGVFGDATGADVSNTWTAPYDGPVGVKATNSLGRAAIAYGHATVTATNHLPAFGTSSPSFGAAVHVNLGTTQAFHVDVTDADSDPVTVTWLLDGAAAGSGPGFLYTPASAGPHTLQVTAADGHGTADGPTWSLVAVAPDADGDGWQANVDCLDTNANVNPGQTEVVGNGIDDDCNPATPDAGSPPSASFTFGAAVSGQPVAFTDSSTDPNGDIATWSWTFGDLSAGSSAQSPSHVYAAAGTYTATLVVTDATGQTSTVSHDVVVTSGPSASFTFAPPAPVTGSFVQFTDTSSDPAGTIAGWSWDFGDGTVSIEQSPLHSFLTPGSYDVTLTITDSLGLVTSATRTVTIGVADAGSAPHASFEPQGAEGLRDAAAASVGGTVSGPNGSRAPITTLIDGAPTDQWWSPNRAAGTAIVLALPGEQLVHGVRLIGQGNGWWEMIKDFDVAVSTTTPDASAFTTVQSATTTWTSTWQEFDLPTPARARYVEIVPRTTWVGGACCYSLNGLEVVTGTRSGRDVHFTNLSANAASSSWSFGDGSTSTDTSPAHMYSAPGDYDVRLTVTSADGRRDTTTVTQHVVGPTAAITASGSPVPGHPVTFGDASTYTGGSFVSRSWDFGDGTTNTSATVDHVFASAGVYAVKLTVTDTNGLSDTMTKNVTVATGGAPIAAFDSIPNGGVYDVGSAAMGAAVSGSAQCCHAPIATLNDGAPSDQWWSSDRGAGQAITVSLAGPEYVDGVRLAGPGCCWWEMIKDFDVAVSSTTSDPSAFTTVKSATTTWSTGWQEFRFSQPYLARYVEIVPHGVWNNGACCYSLNGLQVLSGADSGSPTFAFTNLSANATSYAWDFGDGATSSDASPSHTYAGPGTYTVKLTATGPAGTDVYTQPVVVRGASFRYSPSAPTLDDYVTFEDTTKLPETSQTWDFGDGATSTSRTPAHLFTTAGPHTVTLRAVDVNGNTLTATDVVDVAADAGPVALFRPNGDANAAELETGATVAAHSSFWGGGHEPQSMLDRFTDPNALPWATGNGTGLSTNQFAKIALAPGGPWLIDHVDVMPRPNFASQRVRDFEVWVSTTTTDDGAFTKVLTATTANNGSLQRFDLPRPVLAKYLEYRPLSNWGNDTCCISTQQLRASTGQISEHTVTFSNLSRNATSYDWDFGDATQSTGASPTHTYASAGDYTVTLTAHDAGGASSTFQLVQHVLDPLDAPDLGDNVAAPNEGQTVTFTATPPANLPGTAVNYHWSWGDGTAATDTTAPSAAHSFPDNGTYTVTVTVLDKYLRTVDTTLPVSVANVAPHVALGGDRRLYEANFLQFGYTASDPGTRDNPVCTYDYGDGSAPAVGACGSFNHEYGPGPATYTASVTIKDKDGATGSDSMTVTTLPRAQTGYAATDFVHAGVPGASRFGCCGPIGLAFDSSNTLFMSDYATGYIYTFGAGGGVADDTHKLPNAVGCHIAGLAFSKTGRLYGARQSCSDVVEISPVDGHVIRTVASGVPCATGLAADPLSGDLFATTIGCTGSLERISHFEDGGPAQVTAYGSGMSIDGVTIAPNGTIYVEASGHALALAGTDQPNAGAKIADYGAISTMDGVAVGQSSSAAAPFIFANRNDGIITKVDLTTSPATHTDIFKGGSRGDFVAVGADGCLYATQSDRVVKVTNADGTCSLAGTSAAPQLGLTPGTAAKTTGETDTTTATLTNVTAPAGTVVTFTVTGPNARTGTAVAAADGVATFSYTGTAAGTDTIVATASAGPLALTSNPVTVVWTAPANSPPVAADDHYVALQDQALTILDPGVLANDTDPDGDAITASLASGPAHGSLVLAASGGFVYTPAPGFRGVDSFTYAARDGKVGSQPATVTLMVDGSPTAVDDHLTTHLGTPLTLPDLTANDTDPEGEPLQLVTSSITAPGHGTIAGGIYTPAAGFVGTDSFRYAVTDGLSRSNDAVVTIDVTDAAPVAGPDEATLDENTSTSGNVLANDSDPDGDPLSVALFAGAQHGSVTLAHDGSFTYTPAPGYFGSDAFTYLLSDGGLSVPGTVTLTITQVNRPPVVSLAPVGPIDEGAAPATLTATASDPDADQTLTTTWTADAGTLTPRGGSTATFAADDGPLTAHVTVTVCDDGTPSLCATDSQTLDVRNVAPSVTASASPSPQFWGLPVHVTATADDPSKADTAAGFGERWIFGDGASSTIADTDHVYATPGSYDATFSATDKDGGIGSASPPSLTIAKRTTTVAFTAPLVQPFGPTLLHAQLADTVDAATADLAGRTLTFRTGGRTFTAVTGADGGATVSPAPYLLSGALTVSFAGDGLYLPSTTTQQLTITNAFGGGGFFTVGDRSAALGAGVDFWGPQWDATNVLSAGGAPPSFKGFVDAAPLAGCGGTWTSRPGNSSAPPATLGPYVAVVVPTRVTKSGSAIAGDVVHVVAVRVDPGYGPAPGHRGTGVVVGTVC